MELHENLSINGNLQSLHRSQILHFSHTFVLLFVFQTEHGSAQILKALLFYAIYGLIGAGSITNLMRIPSLAIFSASCFMFLKICIVYRAFSEAKEPESFSSGSP